MTNSLAKDLTALLKEVRSCQLCAGSIPEPRPVLRVAETARILIVGQAPGTRVHATGIPWNDASGRRLREWMSVSDTEFYDESKIAIVPMGFCYPGKGKSGDLPPRPECASTWHEKIHRHLPHIQCTLLIGQYAQRYYLSQLGLNKRGAEYRYRSVTETVSDWQRHAPETFVLPHPSPRNQLWLRRNPRFEAETVPALQQRVRSILEQAWGREPGA